MSKVIFDMSMSLDGYVKAVGSTPDEPLGRGGERLHEWAMGGGTRDGELLAAATAEAGAYIGGRRTYDDSLRWWGADGPTGPARLPLFVLTHRAPDDAPENGVYTFVTDGVESALRQAREAAGGKSVYVMGGPDIGSQFIRAGLVDQIGVHLVPVLFGGGTRLVDHLGDGHVRLERVSVVDTPQAVHLLYDVVK
ncbi:dihydrofolate reductase family protein [Actinomadura livida]|uniref:Dihydrofolate reductase n=1 Tax=Actinomadura livida TaxID=79909 RepID=A0A7W7I7I0_9ACTN|nr:MULTISPECIES: dihydrofolate reductase family protein [Actinomadura]MBB4771618.1 dihydrofolate reductase [Actinomadura catellatispora]GGU01422.1 riboflavin biosynthesis protein [Actinomadura livida]